MCVRWLVVVAEIERFVVDRGGEFDPDRFFRGARECCEVFIFESLFDEDGDASSIWVGVVSGARCVEDVVAVLFRGEVCSSNFLEECDVVVLLVEEVCEIVEACVVE